MQIAVVDLGTGNLRSVEQAVKHVAPEQNVVITADSQIILNADRMVLPGQGAIGTWFKSYQELDLDAAVKDALVNKPCFGICVGMQAMFDYCAEDGGMEGLGVFSGKVEHFDAFHALDKSAKAKNAKIPHMGWNEVEQNSDHPLWQGIDNQARFYFLHSYAATTSNVEIVMATASYHHSFIAAVGRNNVFATQFHPEKSHNDGLQLLRNFANWNGNA